MSKGRWRVRRTSRLLARRLVSPSCVRDVRASAHGHVTCVGAYLGAPTVKLSHKGTYNIGWNSLNKLSVVTSVTKRCAKPKKHPRCNGAQSMGWTLLNELSVVTTVTKYRVKPKEQGAMEHDA
eukprot:4960647-Pleurochrysis_carterae.AAC.5